MTQKECMSNIPSFKEFVNNYLKKLPAIETEFGSHSELKEEYLPDNPGIPNSAKAQIGRHEFTDHEAHSNDKLPYSNALEQYTGGSHGINSHLHERYFGESAESEHLDHIKKIDKELDHSSTSDEYHVFTGLKHDPSPMFQHDNFNKPAVVHHPAYISTSTSLDIAKHFAKTKPYETKVPAMNDDAPSPHQLKNQLGVKHVLKLHLPIATKAGSVEHFSKNAGELEVLVHRGHDIEIHPRPTVTKDGTHVWHAKILKHNPMEIK